MTLSIGNPESDPDVFEIHTTAFDPPPELVSESGSESSSKWGIKLVMKITAICTFTIFAIAFAINRAMVSR